MSREEHQALLNFRLAELGYIPPQDDEELQAFEELHKDYVPRIKDKHVSKNKLLNNMDESKYKGQDRYCVYCDTSSEKDYTSIAIIIDENSITKSELIKHCEKQIKMSPKNGMRYKEHFLLLCLLTGIPVDEENVIIGGKIKDKIFVLPK